MPTARSARTKRRPRLASARALAGRRTSCALPPEPWPVQSVKFGVRWPCGTVMGHLWDDARNAGHDGHRLAGGQRSPAVNRDRLQNLRLWRPGHGRRHPILTWPSVLTHLLTTALDELGREQNGKPSDQGRSDTVDGAGRTSSSS